MKINSKLWWVKWRNRDTHKRSCCTMKAVDKTCLWCFPTYFSSSSSFICHSQHHQVSLPSLSHLHYLHLSFSSASFAPFCDTFAAFPREWTRPRPSGPRVPDGLAGGRIATDPSAAFLLPPPNPRGSEKVQTFSGRMRGRGQREGPRAEGGLRNSRSSQQLPLVLKQF